MQYAFYLDKGYDFLPSGLEEDEQTGQLVNTREDGLLLLKDFLKLKNGLFLCPKSTLSPEGMKYFCYLFKSQSLIAFCLSR